MPLYLFYTMVQKSQKWPKTQIKGGPALISFFLVERLLIFLPGQFREKEQKFSWTACRMPGRKKLNLQPTLYFRASDHAWVADCIVLYLYLFKVGNSTDMVYSKRSHYKKEKEKIINK